jgi:hypothetical protein
LVVVVGEGIIVVREVVVGTVRGKEKSSSRCLLKKEVRLYLFQNLINRIFTVSNVLHIIFGILTVVILTITITAPPQVPEDTTGGTARSPG